MTDEIVTRLSNLERSISTLMASLLNNTSHRPSYMDITTLDEIEELKSKVNRMESGTYTQVNKIYVKRDLNFFK